MAVIGGGFAVVRTAPGKAVALDFREVAPLAATETMYLDDRARSPMRRRSARASGVLVRSPDHALHVKLGKP
jgi:gamma-glutamyltranspeptidase